jgi:hypothetical protein
MNMKTMSLYYDILEELKTIPTVDAHEHLPPEKKRCKLKLDFYSLFEHYCQMDLLSVGATKEELNMWEDRSRSIDERWQSFKKYLDPIRTTGFGRSAMLTLKHVVGFDDLTDENYQEVSQSIQEGNRIGRYDEILKEKCNIVACIHCQTYDPESPEYFFYLKQARDVVDILSMSDISRVSEESGVSIHTLDDFLDAMTTIVETWENTPKILGIKSGHAYYRSLDFKKVAKADAERVFNYILTHGRHNLSLSEALVLQDYLMFELADRAEALKLPLAFHTGIQAGNCNRIRYADPLKLQTLLEEFPRAKFDLYHGGIPWTREIAILAKNFPGVHLNMTWIHIVNPAQACSTLSEWLDMIPNTKIFGFGGDYNVVEKVYGHITIARENIARVLAGKVINRTFNRETVSRIANNLMFENPRRFYDLDL